MGCAQTKTVMSSDASSCRVSLSSSAVARGTVETVSRSDVAVHAYRGIPYAQPPVGPLRFCPPKPQPLWTGERKCTDFGAICPQPMETSQMMHDQFTPFPSKVSEDCLFLNVYAPATANSDSRLPVMVWIHGGAFTIGFSNFYEGTQLASFNNVIVVTVNYRLGAFGFLCTGDDVIPGNYGLLDQVEALKWVRDNIRAFGGDPSNVTLFGESAGAASVHLHLFIEASRGLFHRAILQSGSGIDNYAVVTQTRARELLQNALDALEYKGEASEDLASFLKDRTAEELGNMAAEIENFRCVVDGDVLVDFPKQLYKEGKFQAVPVMTGFTSDEGYLAVKYMDMGQPLPENLSRYEQMRFRIHEMIEGAVAENADVITDAACKQYITKEAEEKEEVFHRQYNDIYTDLGCGLPNKIIGQRHSAVAPVYSFLYAYRASSAEHPAWVKAEHGDDVTPVFGFGFRNDYKAASSETDRSVSRYMMAYWTNFARNGNPNGDGLVNWSPFTTASQTYMILEETPKSSTDFNAEKIAFWENVTQKD